MGEEKRLKVRLAGLDLENPLVLASGIMGTTPGGLNRVLREGAGAVVTKSLGLFAREGHPAPNVVSVSGGYLNAMGLPNPGAEEFAEELTETPADGPVFASVYGGGPDKFLKAARIMAPLVDAIELNLSCPHAERLGAAVGADPALVEEVTSAVKGGVDLPVFAKLTPNVADITKIGRAAETGGADGVVAINTLPGMAIDVETKRPILGNVSGGLSGQAIHPVAVKSVYDLYEELAVPIIGVGGVETVEDMLELVLAGAEAIQIGTAVANRGLEVFAKLRSGLADYLRKSKESLPDLVGRAHDF